MLLAFENKLEMVASDMTLNSKCDNKCKFAIKLVQLVQLLAERY